MEIILVFAAHSDDEILGVGGTIGTYSKQGKEVITIIFSDGSLSSPWLKKDVLIQDRKKEAKDIGRFMGSKETIFLGLRDSQLKEYINDHHIKDVIKKIITRYKPSKIFVHSKQDMHFDHRAVHEMVMKAVEEVDRNKEISIYAFEVWNAVPEKAPVLYVNITETFHKKVQALKKFKSQKVFIWILIIPVYVRAILAGFHNKTRFAEKFYKIR